MTVDDEILKELKEQTRFLKANLGLLSEIKFGIQNARKLSEATYKIPMKKPSLIKNVREDLQTKRDFHSPQAILLSITIMRY